MISPFKPHKTAAPAGARVTDGEPGRGSLLLQVIDGHLVSDSLSLTHTHKEKKAIRASAEKKRLMMIEFYVPRLSS